MVSRIGNMNDGGEMQLACIIATPDVLARLLVAQESIARAQVLAVNLHAGQSKAAQVAAVWSIVACSFSLAALIVVLVVAW